MDTNILCTAPLWSADPLTAIESLSDTHRPEDRELLCREARRLDALLARRPASAAIDLYLAEPETFAARAEAFASLGTFILLEVLDVAQPVWPGWQHPDRAAKRLLYPVEQALVRLASLRSDIAAAQVAALEAGAASGELAAMQTNSCVFEHGRLWIDLPGTDRVAPRRVEIDAWAIEPMTRLASVRPDGPLLYAGASPDPARQQSSVLMSVRNTVKHAGLGKDRSVVPESLRNTGARAAYDAAGTQPLQAAAQLLGLADLNNVARRIGQVAQPSQVQWDNVPVIA